MIKIKKNIPLIDQHDQHGFWGGKFGGNFIPETLKKPIEDLTQLFQKLRYDKEYLAYNSLFDNYVGARQIIEMDINLVQTSCGYAVPLAIGF